MLFVKNNTRPAIDRTLRETILFSDLMLVTALTPHGMVTTLIFKRSVRYYFHRAQLIALNQLRQPKERPTYVSVAVLRAQYRI